MIIGIYVGATTVGVFVYWYCYYDWSEYNHPLVTFDQLRNWSECPAWKTEDFKVHDFLEYEISKDPCGYFTWAKEKPSTMSLTVLVMIEMFNAVNALSDEKSLLTTGIFINMYLIYAIILSTGLHLMILYVEFF